MKTIMELATALADLRVMVVKGQCVTSDEVADAYEALRTRCAELEADAKRYRWLRSTTNFVTSSSGERLDIRDQPDVWDSAIDAAIKDAP